MKSKEMPRAKEYLKNAEVSIGLNMMVVHLFFILGHGGAAANSLQLNSISNLSSSISAITRLWNDVETAKVYTHTQTSGKYTHMYNGCKSRWLYTRDRGSEKDI